jgi:hypothetical protein
MKNWPAVKRISAYFRAAIGGYRRLSAAIVYTFGDMHRSYCIDKEGLYRLFWYLFWIFFLHIQLNQRNTLNI